MHWHSAAGIFENLERCFEKRSKFKANLSKGSAHGGQLVLCDNPKCVRKSWRY